ncbi:MAG: rhodanese-like domain-containing protein [Chitinophagales bacterium]|nr:rhodanese-like domain-containing protein [Chitinophagales bacterium]
MKEITVQELKQLQDSKADFQLIDVREEHEYDMANLGGELIPLATVPQAVDRIARDKQVIIHCRSGMRSANAIKLLEEQYGFDNLYNLKGGIMAYANEIDPSLPR